MGLGDANKFWKGACNPVADEFMQDFIVPIFTRSAFNVGVDLHPTTTFPKTWKAPRHLCGVFQDRRA